jgi:hypothetical protein
MNSRNQTGTRTGWLSALVFLGLALTMVALPGAISQGASGTQWEKLTYALRWGPIRAGTATLESVGRAEVNGCQALHFLGTIETDSFVAAIHSVRNRLEGFTDLALSHSLLYRKNKEEEGELSDAQVVFDTEKNTATYCKIGHRCKKPIAIRPDTFDPISCIFRFRKLSLAGVSETRIHVSDGRRALWVPVRILGRESITTPAGTFSTLKVEALIERERGLFNRDRKARLLVWFTDNQERLPVMAQGELVFGPLIAELTAISRPMPKRAQRSGAEEVPRG